MVFSSLLFLFRFLPLVLLLYYLAPKRLRNLVIFLFSLVFYAWGEPVYVVLILLSTAVDYTAGRLILFFRGQGRENCARRVVFGSVFINLSLLAFFKYADFLLQTFHQITRCPTPSLQIALPIGISFYTFQTMSYTIDVYRGDAGVQKNFISFGAYVALFPQLIAGPIIRYKTVAAQLEGRRETVDDFYRGVLRFVSGLGKKVLLANSLGMVWDETAACGSSLTTATAWIGILAFTLQIYFDFSGYSDMAIGLGAMFGFHFPENFQYPYESGSITEFWRRWHISLGTWFREYVYIPLGGNRKGAARQMANLAAVWLLTGLWHGASWNFVLWGAYYGILLAVEKLWLGKAAKSLPGWAGHVYTIAAVMFGWALFSWPDMADAGAYMRALFFQGNALADRQAAYLMLSNGILFLVAVIGCTSLPREICLRYLMPEGSRRRDVASGLFVAAVFLASVAMLVNSSYNPFLYFRF